MAIRRPQLQGPFDKYEENPRDLAWSIAHTFAEVPPLLPCLYLIQSREGQFDSSTDKLVIFKWIRLGGDLKRKRTLCRGLLANNLQVETGNLLMSIN
nr:unnamed protein product [Callosobruchus chinensis]